MISEKFFNKLIKKRKDSEELIACMKETVDKLLLNETLSNKPGILLGKIQSGKTRAFIGIIALCFDKGYDVAVILTKGTKALTRQTVQRMEDDFSEFIDYDRIKVFNVMTMPDNLTAYERNQKLVIVAKKEINNMKHVLNKLGNVYPDLREKKILIVDDEADYASVSFRKYAEAVEVGRISSKIDELRRIVNEVDYLQVTATPYSLYLQPNIEESTFEFLPKRPAFTVLLPIHEEYIGGNFYFYKSENPDSIAYYIFEDISVEEREVLKAPDGRRFKLEDVLKSYKIATLRRAIMNFIVGAIIRRLQQHQQSEREQKYAFVAHSEISRTSHRWQHEIVCALVKEFIQVAKENEGILRHLVKKSYEDLVVSVKIISNKIIPDFQKVYDAARQALMEEHIMITVVNSDRDIEELLDNQSQLKLRNPMNIYIGGQILDRGITIQNLIGFYYGRNPKRFQQDTVLQHSRMYGARPIRDLAVTRFYTTHDIYDVMKRIHDFDTALRKAFELGDHKNGVYFIRKDVTGKLAPCSPNKLLLSSLTTLRPYKRMLPIGFQTGYKTHINNIIKQIDEEVATWFIGKDDNNPILVELKDVIDVIVLIEKTLEFSDNLYQWDWDIFKASLEHLSISQSEKKEKVWILIRRNRNMSHRKQDGGYSDAPDTQKTEGVLAKKTAVNTPMLMLFRQSGLEEQGWRDTPFWWPVLIAQRNMRTTIFASDTVV